ncbi:MAG: thioredoxin family protein [Candidatus Dormibacteria bacterium]
MNIQRLATLAVAVVLVTAIGWALLNQRASVGGALGGTLAGANASSLPTGPAAPEFTGITGWDNSPPLTMEGLRGKVVLVDFWTYSCINCQRTIPVLKAWWQQYRDQGLVIVGVHSPEFDFEKSPANVKRAIGDLGVQWPVALDPNMATWNAYQNQYWPAEYLVDRQGRIRHTHFGEGEYDVTEAAIKALLGSSATPGASAPPAVTATPPGTGITQEAYAGSDRSDGRITLDGAWTQQPQYALSGEAGASASIDFTAQHVYLVAGSESGTVPIDVTIDGRPLTPAEVGAAVKIDAGGRSVVTVGPHDLYELVALSRQESHSLRLSPNGVMQLFTFTFG